MGPHRLGEKGGLQGKGKGRLTGRQLSWGSHPAGHGEEQGESSRSCEQLPPPMSPKVGSLGCGQVDTCGPPHSP